NPKTALEINAAVSFCEGTALNLVNGKNNNLFRNNAFSQYLIQGPTSSFSLTGISPASGADGQILTLINNTSQPMNVIHNSIDSSAENRIFCLNNRSIIAIRQYGSLTLQYNNSLKKWMVISLGSQTSGNSSVSLAIINQGASRSTIQSGYFKVYRILSWSLLARPCQNSMETGFTRNPPQFSGRGISFS